MKIIGYGYRSASVISFHPSQGDHIKRLPLYKSHLVVPNEIAAILDITKQTKSN